MHRGVWYNAEMEITTRLEFDAGHRIPDHKSQCRNLHGHRYALEITLSGEIIDAEHASENGMVMDFADVKRIARETIVDRWDHAFFGVSGRYGAVGLLEYPTQPQNGHFSVRTYGWKHGRWGV